MFDRVTNDELWSCTSCKACDEICPVNIEILDKILDMRRYKSLMESDFPAELGNAYRAMENSGNPWSISQTERADWIGDMEGIEVLAGGDPFESEWLYWVGCAGSFDDKNKKSVRQWRSCCSVRTLTSVSWDLLKTVQEIQLADQEMNISSRCLQCRTSKRLTAWV